MKYLFTMSTIDFFEHESLIIKRFANNVCYIFKYDISTNTLTFLKNGTTEYSGKVPHIDIYDMKPRIDLSNKEQMLSLISKRMVEIIYEKL